MTEAQMMARRALQEALDRRDNGGAPSGQVPYDRNDGHHGNDGHGSRGKGESALGVFGASAA